MDPIASDLARANMIEQQIRPCEVLDDRVLDAMNSVPREEFVAPEYVGLAFTDTHVPIQDGELMMKPIQEGAMLQALNIKPGQGATRRHWLWVHRCVYGVYGWRGDELRD